jgi:glycosyltransferase involved in cell wall biosynthesis
LVSEPVPPGRSAATPVTVAIPTYRRPQLLARALDSVARQPYPALEVLVADNATEGDEVAAVVESFRARIPGLRFVRHAHNIGAVANFDYCLAQARGEYFMWLADDDELAPDSIGPMARQLDAEPSAVTVMPHWRLKRDDGPGAVVPPRSYESPSALRRALRYVWRANDAFYYALHRRAALQRCRFVDFAWPNRGAVADVSYTYLMTLVLAGRIVAVREPRVEWINHAYTVKSYARSEPFWRYVAKYVLRRINVHAIYTAQVRQALGRGAALLVPPVSGASIVAELATLAARKLGRRLRS